MMDNYTFPYVRRQQLSHLQPYNRRQNCKSRLPAASNRFCCCKSVANWRLRRQHRTATRDGQKVHRGRWCRTPPRCRSRPVRSLSHRGVSGCVHRVQHVDGRWFEWCRCQQLEYLYGASNDSVGLVCWRAQKTGPLDYSLTDTPQFVGRNQTPASHTGCRCGPIAGYGDWWSTSRTAPPGRGRVTWCFVETLFDGIRPGTCDGGTDGCPSCVESLPVRGALRSAVASLGLACQTVKGQGHRVIKWKKLI